MGLRPDRVEVHEPRFELRAREAAQRLVRATVHVDLLVECAENLRDRLLVPHWWKIDRQPAKGRLVQNGLHGAACLCLDLGFACAQIVVDVKGDIATLNYEAIYLLVSNRIPSGYCSLTHVRADAGDEHSPGRNPSVTDGGHPGVCEKTCRTVDYSSAVHIGRRDERDVTAEVCCVPGWWCLTRHYPTESAERRLPPPRPPVNRHGEASLSSLGSPSPMLPPRQTRPPTVS